MLAIKILLIVFCVLALSAGTFLIIHGVAQEEYAPIHFGTMCLILAIIAGIPLILVLKAEALQSLKICNSCYAEIHDTEALKCPQCGNDLLDNETPVETNCQCHNCIKEEPTTESCTCDKCVEQETTISCSCANCMEEETTTNCDCENCK